MGNISDSAGTATDSAGPGSKGARYPARGQRVHDHVLKICGGYLPTSLSNCGHVAAATTREHGSRYAESCWGSTKIPFTQVDI